VSYGFTLELIKDNHFFFNLPLFIWAKSLNQNMMIDSGADPEEVVSNPISCEFFFIKIM
jgi:hypothetical protein